MDAQGTLQNIVVMHEDVTAQKQLEDAQRLLSEKYGILVESSNDGIVILQDKLVKFFNKRMLELLDYGEKEVLNHPFVDFISDRYKQEVASQNDMRSDGSISGSRYEAELLAKDRRTIMVEVNASKIEYDGRPASMAVIRDISRYKEIDKMKSEFVSVVSHQLRTPLTGIKWFTELLGKNKQQNLTDEQKEYVAQIAEGNARMVRLVDDLLNVSRMEQSDKYVIEKQEVDVLSVISKVIRGELVFAQRRGIDIRLDRRCPSVKLVIDEEKLSQVFHNIINNAIKYSLSGAVVEIGCQVKKDEIVYFVKDSGVGIPKAQQRRIFEKFFRADNVASTESGTGLGLYISKFILERHGGRLWFESEQNKGTTFYIALPKK
jgi:PAS domain S-box-containing protein